MTQALYSLKGTLNEAWILLILKGPLESAPNPIPNQGPDGFQPTAATQEIHDKAAGESLSWPYFDDLLNPTFL